MEAAIEVMRLRKVTYLCQSRVWGVPAFQGSFATLKRRFYYEENRERNVVMMTETKLFNFRTRLVRVNHIQCTFMPHFSAETKYFIYNFN